MTAEGPCSCWPSCFCHCPPGRKSVHLCVPGQPTTATTVKLACAGGAAAAGAAPPFHPAGLSALRVCRVLRQAAEAAASSSSAATASRSGGRRGRRDHGRGCRGRGRCGRRRQPERHRQFGKQSGWPGGRGYQQDGPRRRGGPHHWVSGREGMAWPFAHCTPITFCSPKQTLQNSRLPTQRRLPAPVLLAAGSRGGSIPGRRAATPRGGSEKPRQRPEQRRRRQAPAPVAAAALGPMLAASQHQLAAPLTLSASW